MQNRRYVKTVLTLLIVTLVFAGIIQAETFDEPVVVNDSFDIYLVSGTDNTASIIEFNNTSSGQDVIGTLYQTYRSYDGNISGSGSDIRATLFLNQQSTSSGNTINGRYFPILGTLRFDGASGHTTTMPWAHPISAALGNEIGVFTGDIRGDWNAGTWAINATTAIFQSRGIRNSNGVILDDLRHFWAMQGSDTNGIEIVNTESGIWVDALQKGTTKYGIVLDDYETGSGDIVLGGSQENRIYTLSSESPDLYLDVSGGGDVIISGGNLGIGTTSPSYQLHVYEASNGATALLEAGDSSTVQYRLRNTAGEWLIRNDNSADFIIRDATNLKDVVSIASNAPASSLTIDTSGEVLAGKMVYPSGYAVASLPGTCTPGAITRATDSDNCSSGGGNGALCVCNHAGNGWVFLLNY